MRRALLTACLTALGLGALAPAASADIFQTIKGDFVADGEITACRYSVGELNATRGLIPPDYEQYVPGFAEQIDVALQTHAAGGCSERPAPQREEEAPAAAAPAAQPPAAATPEAAPLVIPEPPAPEEPVRQVIQTAVEAPPVQPLAASGTLRGADAPAPVWLLALFAGAGVLAGIAAIVAWWFGWSAERWTRPLAAATADAGGRTADLAGEFFDWLRLGR
jgi:hypothetical protein